MTIETLINRVATKGGITEEGVKIINERLPETINEMFVKTLEKRKITTEKAQKEFKG
jgi:pyrroline-5-carboxylate reductase